RRDGGFGVAGSRWACVIPLLRCAIGNTFANLRALPSADCRGFAGSFASPYSPRRQPSNRCQIETRHESLSCPLGSYPSGGTHFACPSPGSGLDAPLDGQSSPNQCSVFLLSPPVPAWRDLRRTSRQSQRHWSARRGISFLARSYRDQCREGHRLRVTAVPDCGGG